MIANSKLPSSARRREKENDAHMASNSTDKKVRLDSRGTLMSSCQTFTLVAFLVIVIIVAMIGTAFAPDMLIYDEGNVYSCPKDYMNEKLTE